ncbi:hypothetical protein WJX72_006324 [[Myrmecia] bisecta]|uniref:Glycoside hydrolase n=1 Tax=[Myrmecia] bisecta TaxID=41462 RepID=A0AAW1PBS8_9CHLO
MTPESFEIATASSRLLVTCSGVYRLWHTAAGHQRLAAAGHLTLPKGVDHRTFQVVHERVEAGQLVEAEITWSSAEGLEACLKIASPGHMEHSWCKGLDTGFVLEWSVSRQSSNMAEVLVDMDTSGHWFGGGHLMRQLWPLNRASLEVGPFLPADNGVNGCNTLLGAQWMTSHGLLVMADPDQPFLHVGMNAPVVNLGEGWIQRRWGVGVQNLAREYLPRAARDFLSGDRQLRIQARSSYKDHLMHHPLSDWMPTPQHPGASDKSDNQSDMLTVRIALCATQNAREASLAALRTMQPPKLAPWEVISAPIWTTWARYFTRVNQAKVLQYAREIVQRGLQRSVMEIDDRWQSAYGDLEFDAKKFPDPAAMVAQLHEMGFKVTVWVMPFVQENSQAYREGKDKGYFVQSTASNRGLKPGFFHWWNPSPVVALDVTNPEAVAWFVKRLRHLQQTTGIDGFKFDAGEPCFLPPQFKTHMPISHATEYTRLWVTAVAGQFAGGVCEVRTGHQTQGVALLTRMGDRFSTWDVANGLQSLIPTLLTSGLLGYPFTLPDMIGGNAYFGRRPDKELMVRWTQVNALMPAMQFSIAPWDLSKETEKLCAAALDLRQQVLGRMLELASEAAETLSPLARPLWWLDPDDESTYLISDQFAVGMDIIVAPVVEKGAVARDVYLPAGLWRELLGSNVVYQGGQWLRNLDAPLSKLPCFLRVSEVEAAALQEAPVRL